MALKILLTGASGRLGKEVARAIPEARWFAHDEMDVCESEQVAQAFKAVQPDVVIHMAAIADVRSCEENKEIAWKVNVKGTDNVVAECKESTLHPFLLHTSTPCVFECESGGYSETSEPNPVNYYGQTKKAAEEIVGDYDNALILRMNFVARDRWKYPKAFVDRFGTYLFADEIAPIISDLTKSKFRGTVHIAGEEKLSMFELARITTPDVGKITMREADLTLCADMSLKSERLRPFSITKSADRPKNYEKYRIVAL